MKKIQMIAMGLAFGVATLLGLNQFGVLSFNNAQQPAPDTKQADSLALHVHKTPTCGCCSDWVTHLERSGFAVSYTDHNSLDSIKAQYQIGDRYQSCHTGVSKNGYVFEGHVPAKFIEAFLKNPPSDALGLSVPAMPMGSPGMEYGPKFEPYQVLLLNKDGSASVYAQVTSYDQQFAASHTAH